MPEDLHTCTSATYPLPRSVIDSALLLSVAVLYATFGNPEIYLGSWHPGSSGVLVPIAVSGGPIGQRHFLHVACGRCIDMALEVLVAFHETVFYMIPAVPLPVSCNSPRFVNISAVFELRKLGQSLNNIRRLFWP